MRSAFLSIFCAMVLTGCQGNPVVGMCTVLAGLWFIFFCCQRFVRLKRKSVGFRLRCRDISDRPWGCRFLLCPCRDSLTDHDHLRARFLWRRFYFSESGVFYLLKVLKKRSVTG